MRCGPRAGGPAHERKPTMLAPDIDEHETARTAIVDEAIASRRSVRAFLPTPVPDETVKDVLRVASRAPSGTNMQPWKVYVVTGEKKEALTRAILGSGIRPEKIEWDEYRYSPAHFVVPSRARRRAVGFALSGLLDMGRGDVDRMRAHHDRARTMSAAPVGIIRTVDRGMTMGYWVDPVMFLRNVMIAAR